MSKAKYPAATVTVSYHEQMLLVVYRSLTDEGRAAVDRAVSFEWAGRHQEQKLTARQVTEANERFGKASRELTAETTSPDALGYFADLWRKTEAGVR